MVSSLQGNFVELLKACQIPIANDYSKCSTNVTVQLMLMSNYVTVKLFFCRNIFLSPMFLSIYGSVQLCYFPPIFWSNFVSVALCSCPTRVVTNINQYYCLLLHSAISISKKEQRCKLFRFNLVSTVCFYPTILLSKLQLLSNYGSGLLCYFPAMSLSNYVA